jgi:hypothetical protein
MMALIGSANERGSFGEEFKQKNAVKPLFGFDEKSLLGE